MTGGGVYPALAVLQAMQARTDNILWIGSQDGMEASLLRDQDVRFESIPAAGLHGVGVRSMPGNLWKLWKGFNQARGIIRRFKPDVMFFTGGYLGVPVALAGRRIPSVVFVPDIEPGLALKTILRFADSVVLNVPESRRYLKRAHAQVSGYPLRKSLARWTRAEARRHFDIDRKSKVLLVFGGSKGARSINQALYENLETFLPAMHVIHISGQDNWSATEALIRTLNPHERARYHAFPYLQDEMGAAFRAADLAVCRAGASVLGELPAFGLPALLAPYPHAWRYQHQNASYLQTRGGALIVEDDDLQSTLLPLVMELMEDEKRLSKMGDAMKAMFHPDAAEKIAAILSKTGNSHLSKEDLYD